MTTPAIHKLRFIAKLILALACLVIFIALCRIGWIVYTGIKLY